MGMQQAPAFRGYAAARFVVVKKPMSTYAATLSWIFTSCTLPDWRATSSLVWKISFAFLCISVWVADRWLWWTLDQVLREEKSFSSSSGHWASQPSRKKNTLKVICRIIIMLRIWYFFPVFQQADEPINVGSYLRPSLGFAVTDTMSFAQSFVERIILSYLWPAGTEHWCTHQWFLSANSRLVSILAAVFWTYRLFKRP